ncbi:MAG: hypothetical protein LUE96_11715 [Lachnospiraceae bacterium]|nr:hypothetical protein [Lachnospiraceae bacterium]
MFNYVIMAGSGAITYLLVQKCSGKCVERWHDACIEFFMYVMTDMLTVYFCMSPLGRVTRVDDMTGGVSELQYGNMSILFSIVIAVVWGIVFSFLKKKVDVKTEISEK